MVPANNLKSTRQLVNYPRMKRSLIKIFSSACVICGIASISLQTVTLVIFLETFERYYVYFPSDVVGHGIWGGMLYLAAGSLGFAAAYMRKKTLLVGTVVTSALSIFASFLTSLLSAGAASSGVYGSCYRKFGYFNSICDTWLGLEWTLLVCGILAFISSTSLTILASGSLCTCCRKHNTIADVQQECVVTLQGINVGLQVPVHQQQQI